MYKIKFIPHTEHIIFSATILEQFTFSVQTIRNKHKLSTKWIVLVY
jgi:hypothetical protein